MRNTHHSIHCILYCHNKHLSTYWSLCVHFRKWLITRDYLLTSSGVTSWFNHLQTLLKTFPPFTGASGVVVVVGCSRWQLTDSGAVSTCTPEPQTETNRKAWLWHTVMVIFRECRLTCEMDENLYPLQKLSTCTCKRCMHWLEAFL